jgi:signal transduction histidine kinase
MWATSVAGVRALQLSVVAIDAALMAIAVALVRSDPDLSIVGPSHGLLVLEVIAGMSLAISGAIAIGRQSTRTAGVLLAGAAAAWFMREWNIPSAGSSVVFTLGLISGSATAALLAHAAFRYPRQVSPWSALIVLGYGSTLLVQGLAPALFFDPQAQGCSQCPRNLLLVHTNQTLADRMATVGDWTVAAWTICAVAAGLVTLARGSPALRRLAAPVVIPAMIYIAAGAWELVRLRVDPTHGADAHVWMLQAAVIVAVAAGAQSVGFRARLARLALTRSAVGISRGSTTADLRSTLALLLGDPSLQVLFPLTDGTCINERGAPDEPAPDHEQTSIVRGGQTVAVLAHRPGALDHGAMFEEITAAARLAINYQRFQAETLAQLASLRAARARVVAASDAERYRLERNLHDGAQQRLVSLAIGLQLAKIGAEPDSAAWRVIDHCRIEVAVAIDELRTLAHGLYPNSLAEEGLGSALETLAEAAPVTLDLEALPTLRYAAEVESTAYFIVLIALRRFVQHQARVAVTERPALVQIRIEVDAMSAQPVYELEDRVGAIDGSISITSKAGSAATILVELPCVS